MAHRYTWENFASLELQKEETDDINTVSALAFSKDGNSLALGNAGGEVFLYEVDKDQQSYSLTPEPFHSFQAHQTERDMYISGDYKAKITQIEWLLRSSNKISFLTSNERSVKLWKVSDYRPTVQRSGSDMLEYLTGVDSEWDSSTQSSSPNDTQGYLNGLTNGIGTGPTTGGDSTGEIVQTLKLPTAIPRRRDTKQKCVHTFAKAHPFYIHSVSSDLDEEYMLTCDEIRINLWSLYEDRVCYKIHDITPENIEDLEVVLTSACFSPVQAHTILFSNTSGEVLTADLRQTSSITPRNMTSFSSTTSRVPLNDLQTVVKGVRSCKFSQDGQYVFARDYLSVRVWDVRNPSTPVMKSIQVMKEAHESLKRLSEEQDIDDKFQISCSPKTNLFSTGGYNGNMKMVRFDGGSKKSVTSLRVAKIEAESEESEETGGSSLRADLKVLHTAWHPTELICAGACKNSVSLFNRGRSQVESVRTSVAQLSLDSSKEPKRKMSAYTPGIPDQDGSYSVILAPKEKEDSELTKTTGNCSSATETTTASTSSRRTTIESEGTTPVHDANTASVCENGCPALPHASTDGRRFEKKFSAESVDGSGGDSSETGTTAITLSEEKEDDQKHSQEKLEEKTEDEGKQEQGERLGVEETLMGDGNSAPIMTATTTTAVSSDSDPKIEPEPELGETTKDNNKEDSTDQQQQQLRTDIAPSS